MHSDPTSLQSAQSEWERSVGAHAQHFVALLEREGPKLSGAGLPDGGRAELRAMRRLGLEEGNLLAAVDAAVACREPAWLLPLGRLLWRQFVITSNFSAINACYERLFEAAK